MAENGPKIMEKIDDDSGITMVDVLEEEEELENDADAVLGGSDDKNCTYIEGYVKRQALYACKTCTSGDSQPGGVCLACSYACHEGHDLYELYTKRQFRCDCGNSKFVGNECSFFKNKAKENDDNTYNQNFFGKYCTCSRPYPDSEDDNLDEMIQCIVCEDWYHSRHLGNPVPDSDFSEMICDGCMNKNSFLWKYQSNQTATEFTKLKTEETDFEINVEENLNTPSCSAKSPEVEAKPECVLKSLTLKETTKTEGSAFWPEGWRNKLCKCSECLSLYETNKCSYLIDAEDTVQSYEDRGKSRRESGYDKGLLALNSLGRVQQVEAIHEYNSMKTELKDFLKTFADSKKIVREEDIHDFFNGMQAKKRRKTNEMSHFCR